MIITIRCLIRVIEWRSLMTGVMRQLWVTSEQANQLIEGVSIYHASCCLWTAAWRSGIYRGACVTIWHVCTGIECCNASHWSAMHVLTPSNEEFCTGPDLEDLAPNQVLGAPRGWLEMLCTCQPCFCSEVLSMLSIALLWPTLKLSVTQQMSQAVLHGLQVRCLLQVKT